MGRRSKNAWEDDIEDPMVYLSAVSESARSYCSSIKKTTLGLAAPEPSRCPECKMCWRWPRNIALVNKIDPHPRIRPRTKATVVAHLATVANKEKVNEPVICPGVFNRLRLTHDPKGVRALANSVTKEFDYDVKTGHINTNMDSETIPGHSYGRLISLHSWLQNLAQEFVEVSLAVIDHYVNLLLCIEILTSNKKDDTPWGVMDQAINFRVDYFFVGVWSFLLFCTVLEAAMTSRKEWKNLASSYVGDLYEQCNWKDRFMSFTSLAFLNFFQVSGEIKVMVTNLHPWKSVQPFAAAKIDGARVFVIGYQSDVMFRVMDRSGQYRGLALQLFMRTVIMLIKFAVAISPLIWQDHGVTLSMTTMMLFTTSSSGLSLIINWRQWWCLFKDRRLLARRLLAKVAASQEKCGKEKCSTDCTTCTDADRRSGDAYKRILRQELGYSEKRFPYSTTQGTSGSWECVRCGRDALPEEFEALASREPIFREGDLVRLSDKHGMCHDAKYGVLSSKEEVGEVLEVGDHCDERIGRRYLVGQVGDDGGDTWWYDQRALEKTDFDAEVSLVEGPVTPLDPLRSAAMTATTVA